MLKEVIGRNIKEIRNNIHLSQDELSFLVNIERTQISKIESGKVNITIETLEKIAKALNSPIEKLVKSNQNTLTEAKPFVKWAGGKTQILPKIIESLPKEFNTYYEPFLGGGALFFYLKPTEAVINDMNAYLIDAYQCFKNEEDFLNLKIALRKHEKAHNEEYYYQVRNMDREVDFDKNPKYLKAARMIYLNKACFNGLYRVNSQGYFNVPSGKKEVVKTFDDENFDAIRDLLKSKKIKITNLDFEEVVKNAKANDFVYLDPPYDIYPNSSGFVDYGKDGFDAQDQKRLAECFKQLDQKGVYVMLSNHNTPLINELYKEYNIKVIQAKRMINSNGAKRGNVEEVIITNY
ncbi:Dam family site-specific DNA-(adenine-N6)-methyltransferase [Mycoplasma seminis]|uniref:site-specific DNA-methyltransferase (adenine-specific) n=1 Tax=Mycoplasma seminis TaxID=512749 RepID=A0ABY9HCB1_9MOLU|nr:Dam family site-specific DNA-(adenine-N6)-methyltransferase [Mycoplasma seminis]WLP85323.1 Dam family site-specific DNA-(adenine-N6)-methyltransferase [Mycoplasma seminis]